MQPRLFGSGTAHLLGKRDELAVEFSRPIDPASLNLQSFRVIDVATGSVPLGVFLIDPQNDRRVVFRSAPLFMADGQLVFSLREGATYRLVVPSELGGPGSGAILQSTDDPPRLNQSRLICDVTATGIAQPGASFCAGDGSASACPCGNGPGPDRGCPNSKFPSGGAQLYFDSFQPNGAGGGSLRWFAGSLPAGSQPVVLFRGSGLLGGGSGAVFGDGVLCIWRPVRRVATRLATESVVAGQTLTHGAGPGLFRYQLWYRDPEPFCTEASFNVTGGVEVTWP